MSENYRKDVDVYSENCMPEQDKATKQVYRPNSMRRVSAVKELNRLKAQLDALREAFEYANYRWSEWGERAETVGDMIEKALGEK